jgi:hypothetical protein
VADALPFNDAMPGALGGNQVHPITMPPPAADHGVGEQPVAGSSAPPPGTVGAQLTLDT